MFDSDRRGDSAVADIAQKAREAGFARTYGHLRGAWTNPLTTRAVADYIPGFIGRCAKYTESPFAPQWIITIMTDTKCSHTREQHKEQVLRSIVRRLAGYFHLRLSHDEDGIFLAHGSEKYHIEHLAYMLRTDIARADKLAAARGIEREAISAFRKRAAGKIELEKIKTNASRVYVSYADSIAAGNCVSMTAEFAKEIWAHIKASGPCAVRGDIVLSLRHDNYAMRAINYALANH